MSVITALSDTVQTWLSLLAKSQLVIILNNVIEENISLIIKK
jgi:hypothetical protein